MRVLMSVAVMASVLLVGDASGQAPTLRRPEVEVLVLSGVPTVRADTSINGSISTELTASQGFEFRLLITKVGDRYFWKSRENRELVYFRSSSFDYFVSPVGAGYIKVNWRDLLKVEPLKPARYFEHLPVLLDTITYWGEAEGNYAP